jgi:hypothetical protein
MRNLAYLALAFLALMNGGCLAVLAGVGIAGGCCGVAYVYARGKLCAAYNVHSEQAWTGARAGLGELGMAILLEDKAQGHIDSRTADGTNVRIFIRAVPGKTPTEGPVTEICIRVGVFGDRGVSERILDRIGSHLGFPVPCSCGADSRQTPGQSGLPGSPPSPLQPVPASGK